MEGHNVTEYRAEVEAKAKVLKELRRDLDSSRPPVAYDKFQLRDWLASLRIIDERERTDYIAAMVDFWFVGAYPHHLTGTARAYFDCNLDRLSDNRADSFRKAGMIDKIDLDTSVCPDKADVSRPVSHPVLDEVSTVHSYKLPTTSHEPVAIDQSHKAMVDRPEAEDPSVISHNGMSDAPRVKCAGCGKQYVAAPINPGGTAKCPFCKTTNTIKESQR